MTTARAAGSPPRADRHWMRLADARPTPAHRRPPTARRVLTQFVLGNLLAVTVVIAGTVWISGRAALTESLADAQNDADMFATVVVEPGLTDAVVSDAQSRDFHLFDESVREAARNVGFVRVKIWSPEGTIVYSDEPQLIGLSPGPPGLAEDQTAVLATGDVESELSELDGPENKFERPLEDELLEVYLRVETSDSGQPLLFETYSRYDDATARQRNILLTFAPISAAALLVLMLLQLPLGLRMMRQLRDGERERVALLARAADASIDERRRVAGSLHDGIVQDLSAASLVITGSVDGGRVRDETALRAAGDAVRDSVTALRSLLIEIYPPHLTGAGLPSALRNLVSRLLPYGVEAQVDVPDDLDPPPETAALVFRVAQEALINIARHAGARHVVVAVGHHDDGVELLITDDGVGFDPGRTARADGHFGLRVLVDLAEEAGATLDLATAPGEGTALRLCVPAP